jgi:phage-related protein
MQLVTSQFDKNDKSAEAVTARNRVLGKEIEEQKSKISALSQALDNASASFGENDKRTQSWQIQLNRAQAELNGMERELRQNNASLDDASKEFDNAGEKADDFGDEVEHAGKQSDDAGDRFDKLGGICKGAAATMAAAFAAVSAAAVAAGKALVNMSVEGAAYADDVLTTATQTGIAADKLQEYMYAAELVDVSTETLTKSMAKQIKSMKAVQDGTKLSSEAYEKLGVQATNADGSLRDSDTVYWEIIDALGKMKNETERDAIAMQILGKSAQELNPLIEAGSARMDELGDAAKKAGYVVSEDMLAAYGALDDQLQYLEVGTTAAKNALGTVLLPVLTDLAGTGTDLLGEFSNAVLAADGDIGKISDIIGEMLPTALSAIMEYIPELLEIISEVVSSLGSAVLNNLPMIIETVTQVILMLLEQFVAAIPQLTQGALQLVLALVSGIVDNLPMIVEAALQVVITLAKGIAEALPELIPQVVQAVITIVNTLVENIPMLIEAALAIIIALAEGIGETLPELAAAIPQILSAVVTALIGALPLLLPAAIDIIFALIEGLLGALPELIAAIPNLILGIVQGILDNLPTLILFAPEIITSIITGLIGAIPQLILALPQVIMSIVDTFREYDWASIGTNLISGLIEGIGGMIEKVTSKIREVSNGIVREFKDFFGINSPSTVFAGFGENLLEGLWRGIQNVKQWLIDKIRSLGSAVTDALKSVLGINSPSKVFEDEIGVNLGLGLGAGFEKSMKQVSKDMQKAIPSDFDIQANINSAVSGSASRPDGGISLTLRIENFYNNSLQDVKELAEEISTVLASEINRKAEAF